MTDARDVEKIIYYIMSVSARKAGLKNIFNTEVELRVRVINPTCTRSTQDHCPTRFVHNLESTLQ